MLFCSPKTLGWESPGYNFYHKHVHYYRYLVIMANVVTWLIPSQSDNSPLEVTGATYIYTYIHTNYVKLGQNA